MRLRTTKARTAAESSRAPTTPPTTPASAHSCGQQMCDRNQAAAVHSDEASSGPLQADGMWQILH